jgi:hypothetical protein
VGYLRLVRIRSLVMAVKECGLRPFGWTDTLIDNEVGIFASYDLELVDKACIELMNQASGIHRFRGRGRRPPDWGIQIRIAVSISSRPLFLPQGQTRIQTPQVGPSMPGIPVNSPATFAAQRSRKRASLRSE